MERMLSYRTVSLAQTGILRDSYEGIEEFTTPVTGFINKCIYDVVRTVTYRYIQIPTRSHGSQATSALS